MAISRRRLRPEKGRMLRDSTGEQLYLVVVNERKYISFRILDTAMDLEPFSNHDY
jgi:hypothetical protein